MSHIVLYAESLTFDPPEWNLGDVAIGETHTKEIKIKSTTDIEITNVRPACECLKVEVASKTVNSRQDGVISATLHIDNTLNAFFRVFFYVHTSDPKNPFTKFYVTGRVKGKGLSNSEIVIFRTSMAKDYQEIQKHLGELRDKNSSLIIKEYLAQDIDSTRLRAQFEKQYSLNRYADVEMFSGNGSFIGKDAIIKEITRMSNTKSFTTGLNGINPINQLNPVVLELLYFYSVGCGGCKEIEGELFPKILRQYGDRIAIRKLDIADIKNYEHLIDLENKYQIKANAPVSIFIGNRYLLGEKEIMGKTETVINDEILRGASRNNRDSVATSRNDNITDQQTGRPVDRIQERFLSFSVLAVIGAGLLDGINPCAFATIIFFISFLTFMGRSRKEIIIVGVFYTMAVFATYLLLGIGVFKALQNLSTYHLISRVILYLTAALVFCLGALSLYDLVNYLRIRKTSGITLQLPLALKQRIHSIIRENVGTGGLVIGALVIGFLVTLFEAVCTGQVYLPTIVFILRTVGSAQVLKDPGLKTHAFSYLVLYNLLFTLPLVVIFILAYYGIGSERLAGIARRHLVLSKALMSAFFIGLGILLLLV
mgnify:FL=1